jgi:hypothetical protein
MATKSELAIQLLEEIKKDPHTKILKLYKGKVALDGIKKLFFEEKPSKATTWAKKWTPYEKSQSVLIITESRLPKRKFKPILGYEFIIGTIKTGSSLGSHWLTEEEGRLKLKELGFL